MSIKPLLKKITNNWPAKAICFVLAAMIYFFHQISLLDTKVYIVPLQVRNQQALVALSGLEQAKFVKIKIRTKREQIASITEEDLAAYVDLSSEPEAGSYDYPVYVELASKIEGLDLDPLEISSQPDWVSLRVEARLTKAVPLFAQVLGTPAYGYKVLPAKVDPPFVTLTGPSSFIDALDEIPTDAISIEDADSSVETMVKPFINDSYVSIMDQSDIKVSIPIVAETNIKEFKDIEVTLKNLSPDLLLLRSPEKISFILEGDLLDIEKLTVRNVKVYADCYSIKEPGSYDVPVKIDIPRNIKVYEQTITTVTVKVEKAAGEGEGGASSSLQDPPFISIIKQHS